MQAQNKYYPSDYDPLKFRSINDYSKFKSDPKSHGNLRRNDKSLANSRGDILDNLRKDRKPGSVNKTITVRFEMPYNIWCTGCENHIGIGVRYNAEKVHVDNYHSTPIFRFSMKCHLCPSIIKIQTDPKNAEYVILEGARKRVEDFDPADAETMVLPDEMEATILKQDAFFRLEHEQGDVIMAQKAAPALEKLQSYNERMWSDPYTLSQKVRGKFRKEKKLDAAMVRSGAALQDKLGLSLAILPASEEDSLKAKAVNFESREGGIAASSSSSSNPIFAKKRMVPSKKTAEDPKQRLLRIVAKAKSNGRFSNF